MADFGVKSGLAGLILLCGGVLGAILIWKPGFAKRTAGAWPVGTVVVDYPCAIDSSLQKANYLPPQGPEVRPLVVSLHTWNQGYRCESGIPVAEWCEKAGWGFIQPDARGPNNHPGSGGSESVIRDVLDAVAFATRDSSIDRSRIYLIGVSGGGHAALMLAAKHPGIWAGVSVWASISDLALWHAQSLQRHPGFSADLEAICGGAPGASQAVDAAFAARSPVHHLRNAIGLPLDINAGVRDGYEGSVPVIHSLRAFNALAAPEDAVGPGDESLLSRGEPVLVTQGSQADSGLYAGKRILYRKSSGAARVTVFDGGHEMIPAAALDWLSKAGPRKP